MSFSRTGPLTFLCGGVETTGHQLPILVFE